MTAAETRKLSPGTRIWCTVRQCAGWYTVTEVRHRDGYIRVEGFRPFCPPCNFNLKGPQS